MQFIVENIKCGGCANTINNKLKALDGIEQVDIDVDSQTVSVGPEDVAANLEDTITNALNDMGYPLQGTAQGFANIKAKAKSFASCAVGRMSDGE